MATENSGWGRMGVRIEGGQKQLEGRRAEQ
jgi:hypothetical protein